MVIDKLLLTSLSESIGVLQACFKLPKAQREPPFLQTLLASRDVCCLALNRFRDEITFCEPAISPCPPGRARLPLWLLSWHQHPV